MKSVAMCKNEEDHVNIISDAYNGYLNHESQNVITITLLDKKTVMNVNVAMLRVFSPLINTILSDAIDTDIDILLPDFSVECFHNFTLIAHPIGVSCKIPPTFVFFIAPYRPRR